MRPPYLVAVLLAACFLFLCTTADAGWLFNRHRDSAGSCANGQCQASPAATAAVQPAAAPVQATTQQPAAATVPATPCVRAYAPVYRPRLFRRFRARRCSACSVDPTKLRGEIHINVGPIGFDWKRQTDWKPGTVAERIRQRRAARR